VTFGRSRLLSKAKVAQTETVVAAIVCERVRESLVCRSRLTSSDLRNMDLHVRVCNSHLGRTQADVPVFCVLRRKWKWSLKDM
jgi:hypothetical protein